MKMDGIWYSFFQVSTNRTEKSSWHKGDVFMDVIIIVTLWWAKKSTHIERGREV